MNINDFRAREDKNKVELEKKLDSFKLEKVLSLWYLTESAFKASIRGSKN